MHNAVHYTSSQSGQRQVTLRTSIVDSTDSKPTYAQFIITDTGVGMSSDDLKKIFTQGFRGSKEKTHTGSGIGLATCKRIVEENGGEIYGTSPGRNLGSLFWFTMPVLFDETAVTVTPIIERRNIAFSTMKVLIVDDSRSIRRLLSRTIKNSIIGIKPSNILEVESGELALKENISEYNLIFMDTELGAGKMDGLDVTRAIRAQKIQQPIIFSISGNTDADSLEEAKKAGIDDFFSKEAQPKTLGMLLGKYFHFELSLLD